MIHKVTTKHISMHRYAPNQVIYVTSDVATEHRKWI